MFARKSIGIVLAISLLMVLGCGKEKEKPQESVSEKKKDKPMVFPQTYPEGAPQEIVSEKDGAEMVLIPAGEFSMGDHHGDLHAGCRPVHTVYLDAYYIDVYEVTNAQYATFLNEYQTTSIWLPHQTPLQIQVRPEYSTVERHILFNIYSDWCLIEKVKGTYKPKAGYEDRPVVEVSWYGAAAYAQFYGKRLPIEAEWEKAARGGLVGKKYPNGDTITHDDANYHGDRTAPVGNFAPNGYGLYDMAGNVWE